MADITKKCKQIIKELEGKIKNPEDLEFAKEQVFSLVEAFLGEIEAIQEIAETRVEKLIQNQSELDRRLSTIEKDMYIEDDEDFEIVCPYCNHEFVVEFDELKKEIMCPECNNTIELDWNEEHDCSCCHGDCEEDCECEDCHDCDECEDCEDYEDDDDDM